MTNGIKFKKQTVSDPSGPVTLYHVIVIATGAVIGTVMRKGAGWVATTWEGYVTVTGRTRALATDALATAFETSKAAKPAAVASKAPVCVDCAKPAESPRGETVTVDGDPVCRDCRTRRAQRLNEGTDTLLPPATHAPCCVCREVKPVCCTVADMPDGSHVDATCRACCDCPGAVKARFSPVPGALALILCVLAMSTGACATQATADPGLRSAVAATQAIRAAAETCTQWAVPESRANLGNDVCDCGNQDSLADPACRPLCRPTCVSTAPRADIDVTGSNPGDDWTDAQRAQYAALTTRNAYAELKALDRYMHAAPGTAFVDRIEGSVAVLLLGAKGEAEVNVPLATLPRGTKEGDTVKYAAPRGKVR